MATRPLIMTPRALGEAGECGAKRGAAPEPRLGKFGAGGSSDVTCASSFPFGRGLRNNNLRQWNNISRASISIVHHQGSVESLVLQGKRTPFCAVTRVNA